MINAPRRLFLCIGLVMTVILVSDTSAQDARVGASQRGDRTILTPDPELNSRASVRVGGSIEGILRVDEQASEITIPPAYLEANRWLAAWDLPFDGDTLSFFLYAGWLYTDGRFDTNMRRRRYSRDVTDQIESNAYHLAFHRQQVVENEVVLFLVSPTTQTVRVELDADLFGQDRTLEFEMEEGEGRFVHLVIPPEEYTLVTWRPEEVVRSEVTIDQDWRFSKGDAPGAQDPGFDDSGWQPVTIPHSWNAHDVYDMSNVADGLDVTEGYYRGAGWYRTSFRAPAESEELHLSLDFLGANQVTDVWLNGHSLGRHVGGYTGFSFDVTDLVRHDAPNELAVRVDNSFDYDVPPHTADYNFYGGLYREVKLVVTAPVHVRRTQVATPEVSLESATVRVRTTIRNGNDRQQRIRLVTHIINPYDEIEQSLVKEIELPASQDVQIDQVSGPLNDPLLWSPEHPWLYRVSSVIHDAAGEPLDQTFEPLGLRWFSFNPSEGFFLNGRHLKLRGVNLHQDYLHEGFAVGPEQKREDMLHVKRMGANFVRLAHYPHHPYTLHLADSLGLIIWQEIPVVNTVGREDFLQNARQMLREMIERDANHPSIVMWGVGNEFAMPWMADEDVEWALRIATDLGTLAKELDPTRPTVQGHNHIADERIWEATDLQGRNRYFGWYEGTYDDFAGALDADAAEHPDWKVIISEYGAEGKYGYHVNHPQIFDHSETYQLDYHQAHWEAIRDRAFVAGSALWNMFDFGSTVKIGNIPHINQKGMMTADRKPKSVYFYYQSQWSPEPMIFVVSDTWVHRYGEIGVPQHVEVFSNCDRVDLRHNGVSLGAKESTGDPLVWEVPYLEGENRLEGIGTCATETVSHTIVQFYHASESQSEPIGEPGGEWRSGDELPDPAAD